MGGKGSGRKPLSTLEKRARGTFVTNPNRENKNEPQPVAGEPEMPELVAADPVAKAKWADLCKWLGQMKLLATSDGDLMASYCLTWSRFVSLTKAVNREGIVVGLRVNPKQKEANLMADRLYRLTSEFGLSPSSRSRLKVIPGKKDEDVVGDFFKDLGAKNS